MGRRPHPNRPHWSYSQLNQYRRCPLQYYFERIERLPVPFTAGGLAFGSAVHAALADVHRSLQSYGAPSSDSLRRTFLDRWAELAAERPIRFRPGENLADMQELGLGLLGAYVSRLEPMEILAVEREFVVPLINSRGEVLERPLVAVPDLLIRENGALLIDEFKTAFRRPSSSELDLALQATCYAWAVRERYGSIPSVRCTTLLKTRQPQVHRLATCRVEEDFGRLGDLVEHIERATSAGAFYPIENPQSCVPCPFRKACRERTGAYPAVAVSPVEHQEAVPC